MTRRDTKAIEAAGRAAYEDFNSGLIGCCEDPWDKLPEDFRSRLSNADGTAINAYLAHLAEHGDDDGRKWKLVPVEPTPAMADAFWSVLEPAQVNRFSSLYGAALAAAPSLHGSRGIPSG